MPARRKFLFFFLIALAIFLFSQKETFAAMSLTFSGAPSSVEEENSFEVDVSLVDAPTNRTYYLRAAFHEEGKSQYFGYTFNHEGSWYNSPGEHTKFLEIGTSEEGSWSGKLKAKADLAASAFKGAGNYSFKIGRYTEGGSLSWSNNSTTITINVQPTPTPVPTDTPTPESPTSTPTPEPPTSTPTLSPTPTPKATKVVGTTLSGEILGEEASPEAFYPWQATTEGEEAQEATPSKRRILPYIFLGLGLTFLGVAAFWLWYTRLRVSKEGT